MRKTRGTRVADLVVEYDRGTFICKVCDGKKVVVRESRTSMENAYRCTPGRSKVTKNLVECLIGLSIVFEGDETFGRDNTRRAALYR